MTPVAVVTGAGRGIGAATVRSLTAANWSVLATDSAADDPALPYAMATQEDLQALEGPTVRTAVVDVRDGERLRAAVEQAVAEFGPLTAAIGCAGVAGGGRPAWEVSPATERAVLSINLDGIMNLARAAVPALLAAPAPRQGRFLAVASAAATRGLPMMAAYCAAKAGVAGFVRALAAELGDSGVTANAVSPGSTDTDILAASAALYDLPDPQTFAAQQPIRRLLQPEEIAAVLTFLAGPASSAMTGAVVPVDGGLAL